MQIKSVMALALGLLSATAATSVQAQLLGTVLPPPVKVGCDWFLAYGPGNGDVGNTAFPEANSHYWLAVISETVPVGARLKINGKFPDARYSAFHVHNGNLEVMDSIADFRLAPNAGSLNPFPSVTQQLVGAPSVIFGGAYAATLRFHTAVPAQRAANTIYRPAPAMFDGVTKKRTVLSYRTYLKSTPLDVPPPNAAETLPILTLEVPTGVGSNVTSTRLSPPVDAAACAALRASYSQSGAAVAGSANLVEPLPPAMRPQFKKYAGAAYGALGAAVPTQTGTVGYNPQNGFLYVKTSTTLGELLLVRGKAPSYTTQAAVPGLPQVRYWSLCQYGFNSQKVVGCLADRAAVLDAQGFYTAVIAPGAQPPLATAAKGLSWMPWGPEAAGDVILRYLLERPDFVESIANVPLLQDPTISMGAYAPRASYCSRAVFAAAAAPASATAETIFAACLASR